MIFYKVEKKVKILSEMIICDCVLQKEDLVRLLAGGAFVSTRFL